MAEYQITILDTEHSSAEHQVANWDIDPNADITIAEIIPALTKVYSESDEPFELIPVHIELQPTTGAFFIVKYRIMSDPVHDETFTGFIEKIG